MSYEPRAVVTESLDSKQSNMAFDWLMNLLKECYDPVELQQYQSRMSMEYWVNEDLGMAEGSIAWTHDPKTGNELLILALGDGIQVCYSKRHFQRQAQIMFAAPTAMNAPCQVAHWGRYLVELSQFYQNSERQAA